MRLSRKNDLILNKINKKLKILQTSSNLEKTVLRLEKILKDKPPEIQLIALYLASNWMLLDEFLQPAKDGEIVGYLSSPSFKELDFYAPTFLDFALQTVLKLENISTFPVHLGNAIKHCKEIEDKVPPDQLTPYPQRSLEDAIEFELKEYRDYVTKQECNEKQRQEIKEHLLTPEFSFLCRVFMPCLFFYNSFPQTLFKQAILGDLSSLKKLLRLDKSLVHHPEISKFLGNLWYKDKIAYEELIDALKNPLPHKYSKQYLKYRLSGLLALLSDYVYDYKWTEHKLRELFDAIAVDHRFSDLIDEDLSPSPDAYRKAIASHKEEWLSLCDSFGLSLRRK